MRRRIVILAFVPLVALLVLLAVHVRWLLTATKDPRFVRFMRRYDRRSNVEDILPPHGVAVDARGERLDVAEPGSMFQHVLDDLSLEGGGASVCLTIDARLQNCAASLMKGRAGAVVALEPSTGRVLALVSSPRAAYLNRALNGLYPPGSTFKVFMGAAAISAGYEPIFDCPAEG